MSKRTIRDSCGTCGSTDISLNSILGQNFKFKDYKTGVLITKSQGVELVQCNSCGEHFFQRKHKASQKLDEAIKASIQDQWNKYLSKILAERGIRQKELADKIGMSQEQISRLKKGREVPSFKSFLVLKILASCPGALTAIEKEYNHK